MYKEPPAFIEDFTEDENIVFRVGFWFVFDCILTEKLSYEGFSVISLL